MKRIAFLPPVALAALAACSGPRGDNKTEAPPRPVHVETAVVAAQAVPQTLLLTGTLKANQESDLAANATGLVKRTMVDRGSYVKKGEPIAQLDVRIASLSADEAQASLDSARARKAAAERDCERAERLFKNGILTQQEYDRQTTSCKTAASSTTAAAAHVEVAKQQLVDGTVRAPFAGLVSERYVSVGEYVMPNTKVAHLVDIDPLRLELTIPAEDMAAVKQGLKVDFTVAAFPGRTFTGTVEYIGPAVRPTTRDLVFEAVVENADKALRPGLFATARVDVGTRELPVVPKAALVRDGDSTRTFAVVDGHVEERIVEEGPAVGGGDLVAVLKGLKAGERVVLHPGDDVADGAPVASPALVR